MPRLNRCRSLLVLLYTIAAVSLLPGNADAGSPPTGLGQDSRASTLVAARSLGHAQHALARASMALTGLGRAQQSEHGRPHIADPRGSNPRGKVTRWIWDGNVPLHEWVDRDPNYVEPPDATQPAQSTAAPEIADKARTALRVARPSQGPPSSKSEELDDCLRGTRDAPITWLFEPESFAPLGKLVGDERFGIVTDHLGTPSGMFDAKGAEVWGADIDVYGELRNLRGAREACPFRWPGQYEDAETGLYYNRFRYYDREAGQYASQDPIGLLGTMRPSGYVWDPTAAFDPLGLKSCRPTSKRVFWSGGDVSRDAAEAWAKKHGYTSLEMTATGRLLERTTKGKDWFTVGRPKFANASERYAKGARGDVHVFQRESGVRTATPGDPGTIWQEREYPALKSNPKVKNIIYHLVRDDGSSYVVP